MSIFIQLCLLPLTSSLAAKSLASTPSTSRFVDRVVLKQRPQAQELNQRSEHWQEMDLRLVELRMSLLFQPIQPDVDTDAEVEDSEHTRKSKLVA
jgi:hypothetical protein